MSEKINTDRPLPPVPPDLDLSGFPWMPLDAGLFLGSKLCDQETPAEATRAAVSLWCLAWRQIPASSLPGDEKRIAALIGLSNQKWKSIREHALEGFVLCADGRLYHTAIAEQAIIAGEKRQKQSARAKAGWSKRAGSQAGLFPGDNLGVSDASGTAPNRSGPVRSSEFLLPPWIAREDWAAFEQHRVAIKAPMTDRARELIVVALDKLDPTHASAKAILNRSIQKGWRDVFPLKDDGALSGGAGLAGRNDSVAARFAGRQP